MKAFSLSILLGAFLSRTDAAEQKHIDDACSDVWGVIGCSSTVTYPDYPKPIYNNGVQIDTEIVTKDVDICSAVDEALGSIDFVNNAETYCSCLSNAIYWGTISNAKPNYDGQINAHLTGPYLDLISKDETIDVATYRKLAKAVMSCYTGTCDGPKVRAFFASYVQNSYSVTESDFVGMLNKWGTLFDTLKKKTADVQTYSKQVQARLKTVSTKVNSVKANVCKSNACKGATPANAFKKYASTIATVKSLQGVPSAAGKSLANIPKMKQITQNAIKYTTTPADEAYYLNLMTEYHVNSLRDVIKAFRVTQYLPQAADDLKKLTGTFNLISNHAGAAKTAATSINQILSVSWAKNSELSKTASGRKVRDGLINIQKSFRNDLKGPLDNLIKANKAVEDILVQLPLRKKRLEFSSGGVSYSRWIEAKMPVPCKKEKTYSKTIGGFSKSMSPLAMGTFATTLLTLSLSMMGFRGVETQTIFIGNLCFAAGLCMFVSAQWEMARGNTFGYSALSAYAVFYGGYGVILCPSLGVLDSYGGPTPEYHNALGFYALIFTRLTNFSNLVSFGIFTTIFFCFTLDAASNFAHADGKVEVAKNLMKAAGVFGFVSGLLGYYSCAAAMCADALPFELPCGDTSRFFKKTRKQL
ncbi:hypothetical protein BFJ72_g3958 [Fusarium proliferatum]|uniref:Uncharacterized protein n=1 Tax=Gibberella intermedia TaxID=948311 RepID=A0A420TRM4_GIBIN|nr:hypothetical protein BFJ72_g3958 [Fusarium proliferatum]